MKHFGYILFFGCIWLTFRNCGGHYHRGDSDCLAGDWPMRSQYTIAPGLAMPDTKPTKATNVYRLPTTLPFFCAQLTTPYLYTWKIRARYTLPNKKRDSFRLQELTPTWQNEREGGLLVYDPKRPQAVQDFYLASAFTKKFHRPKSSSNTYPATTGLHKGTKKLVYQLNAGLSRTQTPLVVLHLVPDKAHVHKLLERNERFFSLGDGAHRGSLGGPQIPCYQLPPTQRLRQDRIYQAMHILPHDNLSSGARAVFVRPTAPKPLPTLPTPNLWLRSFHFQGSCQSHGAMVALPAKAHLQHWYRWTLEKQTKANQFTPINYGGWSEPNDNKNPKKYTMIGYPPVLTSLRNEQLKLGERLRLRVEAIHPSGAISKPQILALRVPRTLFEASASRMNKAQERGMSHLSGCSNDYFLSLEFLLLLWGCLYWMRRHYDEATLD